MIVTGQGGRCVVCQGYIDPLEPGPPGPKHYHSSCATAQRKIVVVWHGKYLIGDEEDLTWSRDTSEKDGLYLGVAFDDERGFYSASIVVQGVESEGEGSTPLESLDAAYEDLKHELFLITGQAFQLGQE